MRHKRKCLQKTVVVFLLTIALFGCSAGESGQSVTEAPAQQDKETDQEKPSAQEKEQTPEEADAEEAAITDSEEEVGFATAEEAVLSYLAGLRDNDFGRAENCFFDKSRAADITVQYAYLCGFDLIPEIASESYVKLSGDGDAEKFAGRLAEAIERTDFENMTFLGFVSLDALFESDQSKGESYQKMLDMVAKNSGGSEIQSQIACVQINDVKYMLFFDTIKVDDKWYVFQLGGCFPQFLGAEKEEGIAARLGAEDEEMLGLMLTNDTDIPKLPEARTGAAKRERTETEGYETPEEAVTAYLEGLKACDTEKMLSTFCVESYAENYDMQAYLEYMQAYMFLKQEVSVPPVNDFTKAMLGCEREGQIKEDMLSQGNALYFWSCYYNDTEPEQQMGWEELQQKLELDSIEVTEFIPLESISENERSMQASEEMWKRRVGIYGADQIQDCVAVFTCGGEKYCLFMEMAQYDGRWYNNSLACATFNSTGFGTESMGTLPLEALDYMQED